MRDAATAAATSPTPTSRLHAPGEVVSEPEPNGAPSYASRSATKQYRTAPLRGVWQHPPYFHNGSAATLEAVVDTYNTKKSLGLTTDQKTRPGAVPEVPLKYEAQTPGPGLDV